MRLCSQGLDSVLSFVPHGFFYEAWWECSLKKRLIMLAVDPNNILHTFQILAKGDIYCLTEIKDSCLFQLQQNLSLLFFRGAETGTSCCESFQQTWENLMLVCLGQDERSPGTYHREGAAQFSPFLAFGRLLGQCLCSGGTSLVVVCLHAAR